MWVYHVVIIILILMLIGQMLAAGGDAFLVLDNSRPVGGDREVLTILAWGFATRAGRSACISDPAGRGINDMRFSMHFGQILLSVVTLGIVRRVNIDYRMFAGNSPVEEA
ncbi:hypothetical protein [Blastomonas sp. AAP25]|uniref:hypothetical protein n=1 Tax=Blastomonas sp. AAP25 TaxID=1523416 RepID=UPI000AA955D2|nr:hypothetical protein [Blastomonas sp. AAP25]